VGTAEVVLALVVRGPRHGYEIKRAHDEWFPESKPLPFGQVYATLGRLERDGLMEAVDTRAEHGPERTLYALTPGGRRRMEEWLVAAAPAGEASADEIVRKTVAALQAGLDPMPFLSAQRVVHLRRMRELSDRAAAAQPLARLATDHLIAHLDADLRWMETVLERTRARGADREQPAGDGRQGRTGDD
jgi:DNA-binding PadR family transcriptional regulator